MEYFGLIALIVAIALWVRVECLRLDTSHRLDAYGEMIDNCGRRVENVSGESTRRSVETWHAIHDRREEIESVSKRVAELEGIRKMESQIVEPASPIYCRCSRCQGPTTRYVEGLMIRDGILWFNHEEKRVDPICFSCCDKAGIPRMGGVQ